MSAKKGIAFLGAGNMAEALIGGLLVTKTFSKKQITAADVAAERLDFIAKKFGIGIAASNAEAVRKAGIALLAVKPQNIKELMEEIAPALGPEKLVISIAAGVRTEKIEQMAGKKLRLVRVMPNMPALVRSGISVYFRGRGATEEDGRAAADILGAVGDVLETADENLLDAVTALSGSGPAYFFYFIEALAQAGEKLGLPADMAARLAAATGEGAMKLLRETKENPSELRRKVTSPGGTTEAALKTLEDGGFSGLVFRALQSAADRGRELSR